MGLTNNIALQKFERTEQFNVEKFNNENMEKIDVAIGTANKDIAVLKEGMSKVIGIEDGQGRVSETIIQLPEANTWTSDWVGFAKSFLLVYGDGDILPVDYNNQQDKGIAHNWIRFKKGFLYSVELVPYGRFTPEGGVLDVDVFKSGAVNWGQGILRKSKWGVAGVGNVYGVRPLYLELDTSEATDDTLLQFRVRSVSNKNAYIGDTSIKFTKYKKAKGEFK